MRIATPREHVEYLKFATRAVARSNRHWRRHHPGRGEMVIDRAGLHAWLYRWAVKSRRIESAGPLIVKPLHAYVAVAFADDPEAVREEALNFWRRSVESRLAEGREDDEAAEVGARREPGSDDE